MRRWLFLGMLISACSSGAHETGDRPVADGQDNQTTTDVTDGAATAMATTSGMVLRVRVPDNTSSEDVITVWLEGNTWQPMQPDGAGAFTTVVTAPTDGLFGVHYRYTRNAYDFPGAEYLEPDTNDYFWRSYGRAVSFSPGTTQDDVVARWRWFPASGTEPAPVPPLTPIAVVPRSSGQKLRVGVYMADLWEPAFALTLTATAERLADRGFRQALLSPPWQVAATDPLPRLENQLDMYPNYPDAMLAAQIHAFADAGIEVIVQPQVHPKLGQTNGRDAAWWNEWFAELTAMHVHHARIARDNGARAYAFYPEGLHTGGVIPDADTRWRQFISALRAEFPGPIGVNIWQFSDDSGQGYVIPDTSEITFWDAVDFISYQVSGRLAGAGSPDDAALATTASRLLAPVLAVARAWALPLTVEPSYAAVAESWRGGSYYTVDLQNAVYNGEDEWQQGTYAWSGTDQARVMHAFFVAAATTPEVDAVLPFGYWPLDFPLSPDFSVRAKAGERILQRWAAAQ